jgi:hypothetical protein
MSGIIGMVYGVWMYNIWQANLVNWQGLFLLNGNALLNIV